VGHALLRPRRHEGHPGIGRELVDALAHAAVLLFRLLAEVRGELLHLLRVAADRLRRRGRVEGKGHRVGEAQDRAPRDLRERNSVLEGGIAEAREMVEGVVDRVIGAAAVLAAEGEVQRGYADVLEEGREVRSRSERREAEAWLLPGLLPLLRRALELARG